MPELPDVVVYLEALQARVFQQTLQGVRLKSPFFLRSVQPPLAQSAGRKVVELRRLGKRIVLGLEGDLVLVIHLMIAGRLHWKPIRASLSGRRDLAACDFPSGTLTVTEAGSKKRASLHLVAGQEELERLDPGGLEVLQAGFQEFQRRLRQANHTLKRALTDPRLLSGIGNAYSDEILHRARLSPLRRTRQLRPEEMSRLFKACRGILEEWTERLRQLSGGRFPEKVTAFREGMSVHGRFRQPCPACSAPIQRIVYSETECHYCPGCQTGGRILADRALSRLLREDWPHSLEELESRHLSSPKAKTRRPGTD